MTKQFYIAKDLQELLSVSESKAYELIRTMNEELQSQGYLTVRGRIPVAYVKKRFFGVAADYSGVQQGVQGTSERPEKIPASQ